MYRQAGRPPLKQIADKAKEPAEAKGPDRLAGTASQETIRRTLRGLIIPERWETVWAVYAPRCALADVDPQAQYYLRQHEDNRYEPLTPTHKEEFRQVWSAAFDTEELPPPFFGARVPSPQPGAPRGDGFYDPWASAAPAADEPPF
ncbi:hypothetical protein DP939_14085 [Spongiactinospora rosea]|uniref:Uncharacterized protein n=1 Tax=Spongiactinospora rosea TaxID=2248750 RepID=A0A366M206_9ACTN|nr:hypothetical protein [Spongiactinospora rosea]RBQ19833.1 hypothetical protein DP939_14085 [Spongiactinospora rosea]